MTGRAKSGFVGLVIRRMTGRAKSGFVGLAGHGKSQKKKVFAFGVVALLISACADDKPLNTFEPRGPKAQDIYDLMTPWVWVIMIVIGVLVVGGAIALAVKNRVKPEDYDPNDLPEQVHGNTKLELAWTIAPGLLLAGLTLPMIQGIWNLEEKNEDTELDVLVIGQQWWWEYRYDVDNDGFFVDIDGNPVKDIDDIDNLLPLEISLDQDDIATATELVIPTGQQVDLIVTSRDVIHSFWIPRLNGKRDAVPGRLHEWSVEADEPGKYTGWCTEFCGLSHARMRMSTVALSPDDYSKWWANQQQLAQVPTDETALAGRQIFINQCQACHIVNEEPGEDAIEYTDDFIPPLDSKAAPNLTHFASRSTFAGGIFNTYLGPVGLPDDDALDVSQYLELASLAAGDRADKGPDDFRLNTPQLKSWVRNAGSQKDMDPESEQGMRPFTGLSDEELNQVVAYLATLD